MALIGGCGQEDLGTLIVLLRLVCMWNKFNLLFQLIILHQVLQLLEILFVLLIPNDGQFVTRELFIKVAECLDSKVLALNATVKTPYGEDKVALLRGDFVLVLRSRHHLLAVGQRVLDVDSALHAKSFPHLAVVAANRSYSGGSLESLTHHHGMLVTKIKESRESRMVDESTAYVEDPQHACKIVHICIVIIVQNHHIKAVLLEFPLGHREVLVDLEQSDILAKSSD